jgi:hypothetical protein
VAHTAVVVPAQIETFFATFFTNDAVWIGRALDDGGGVDGQLKKDSGDKDGSDWDGGDLDSGSSRLWSERQQWRQWWLNP